MGASFASEAGEPVFVLLACEAEDPRRAVHAARGVLSELLRALRLFGDGRIALDALGWVSTGGGPWRALQLPGGHARGGTLLLTPDQEDELRAFCSLVSRRAFEGGRLEWALERFELGCERSSAVDALSDNLLALSALLEDEHSPPGLLPRRLAALCAAHEDAPELARGWSRRSPSSARCASAAAHPGAQGEELARELAEHLRALLRDVICGHLPESLGELADGIIAEADQASGAPGRAVGRSLAAVAAPRSQSTRPPPASRPRPTRRCHSRRYSATRPSPGRSWTSSSSWGTTTRAVPSSSEESCSIESRSRRASTS